MADRVLVGALLTTVALLAGCSSSSPGPAPTAGSTLAAPEITASHDVCVAELTALVNDFGNMKQALGADQASYALANQFGVDGGSPFQYPVITISLAVANQGAAAAQQQIAAACESDPAPTLTAGALSALTSSQYTDPQDAATLTRIQPS